MREASIRIVGHRGRDVENDIRFRPLMASIEYWANSSYQARINVSRLHLEPQKTNKGMQHGIHTYPLYTERFLLSDLLSHEL